MEYVLTKIDIKIFGMQDFIHEMISSGIRITLTLIP